MAHYKCITFFFSGQIFFLKCLNFFFKVPNFFLVYSGLFPDS